MHFVGGTEAGKRYRCDTCPEATQRRRRCHEDRWDFTKADNPRGVGLSVFPIQMQPGWAQHGFCPAKVLRDDPTACAEFRDLYLEAECGLQVRNPAGTLTDEDADLLFQLAQSWRSHTRAEGYRALGKIVGGSDSQEDSADGRQPSAQHPNRRER